MALNTGKRLLKAETKIWSLFPKRLGNQFNTLAAAKEVDVSVKEVYDRIVNSVKVERSAPRNAWLRSLTHKCQTRDDLNLLFDVLQQLRIFRLSNLRIHDNFNCNLCQEVAKACVRAGAVDYDPAYSLASNSYLGSPPRLLFLNHRRSHFRRLLFKSPRHLLLSLNSHHQKFMALNTGKRLLKAETKIWSLFPKRLGNQFNTLAAAKEVDVSVKEVYDRIVNSVKVERSAPRNAWLRSLTHKCQTRDDLNLLFDVLQQLRIFRLSNLRIHDNFNCNLCQEVAKACVRAGAVDYGKKTLCKHNVYGLTPDVCSGNLLLSYAKEQKDVKLMVGIMSHLKKNDLPLQPGTADIVFSICYDADNWELISKYSRRFVKAGVKLRKTTFDTWMEFASKRGDLEALWKIEKSRSDVYKRHTIKSGICCAKGFLLEKKPDSAASVIQAVNQSFPDLKKQGITDELQKLVCEWPAEVIKHQKPEDQKALVDSLKADIPAMLSSLTKMGVKSGVNLDDLNIVDPVSC